MNEKALFAERLKTAMLAAGYEPRPSVLEREFNLRYLGRPLTFQAVRRWLRGDSLPEQDKLQVLADWLGVEPQVLRFGEQAVQKIQENRGRWEIALKGEEREVLQAYLSLPVEQRKVVREVILTFAKACSKPPGEETPG
ncbi:transcriptional regulator [Azorhizophilus paspali]|uniref:Transcriptional regulator n=1 Tax=Azorhizophilus paspali TaxID=69963 RepID=A0ABV6SHS7_AZOPA